MSKHVVLESVPRIGMDRAWNMIRITGKGEVTCAFCNRVLPVGCLAVEWHNDDEKPRPFYLCRGCPQVPKNYQGKKYYSDRFDKYEACGMDSPCYAWHLTENMG